MMNETKKENAGLSSNALKGMQSVRATFTLPLNIINLLSLVSNQLGIKQKSIFDHLIENRNILNQVVTEAKNYEPKRNKRKQKTYVLSRSSLTTLDRFAKNCNLPRDILVEFSVKQLIPVLDAERHKHENRKELLNDMENFLSHGKDLLEKAGNLLGEEDPVYLNLFDTMGLYEKNVDELNDTIEKGKSIEEYQ